MNKSGFHIFLNKATKDLTEVSSPSLITVMEDSQTMNVRFIFQNLYGDNIVEDLQNLFAEEINDTSVNMRFFMQEIPATDESKGMALFNNVSVAFFYIPLGTGTFTKILNKAYMYLYPEEWADNLISPEIEDILLDITANKGMFAVGQGRFADSTYCILRAYSSEHSSQFEQTLKEAGIEYQKELQIADVDLFIVDTLDEDNEMPKDNCFKITLSYGFDSNSVPYDVTELLRMFHWSSL